MPDYYINGRRYRSNEPLDDDELEELAGSTPVSEAPIQRNLYAKEPILPKSPIPTPEVPGMLSSAWSAISTPLTTIPRQVGNYLANKIDQPRLSDQQSTPFNPYADPTAVTPEMVPSVKGFQAGATQGLGEVATQLTSPIDLADIALSGGAYSAARRGMGTAAKTLTRGARVVGAPVAAHGAQQVLSPESTWQERLMGIPELAGGLAATVQPIPEIRPPRTPPPNVPPNVPSAGPAVSVTDLGNVGPIALPPGQQPTLPPARPQLQLPPAAPEGLGQPNLDLSRFNPDLTPRAPEPQPPVDFFQPKPELERQETDIDRLIRSVTEQQQTQSPSAPMGQMDEINRAILEAQANRPSRPRTSEPEVLPAETELDMWGYPKDRDLTPEEVESIKQGYRQPFIDSFGEDTVEGGRAWDELDGTIDTMSNEMAQIVNESMQAQKEGYSVYPVGYKGKIPGRVVRTLSNGDRVVDVRQPGIEPSGARLGKRGVAEFPQGGKRQVYDLAEQLRSAIKTADEGQVDRILADTEAVIMRETDPEIIKDNLRQIEDYVNGAKLSGNADELELIGGIRDIALDKLRQSGIEPSGARTETGGVRMDIGDRKEMLKLFRGTYAGSVPQTATKELIQNAIDAAASMGTNGRIKVTVDPDTRGIQVEDNGPGLTREQIETVFTDLSSSGKRGGPVKTIGEMGAGKSTYLIQGERISVETVSRDSQTGQLRGYAFEGTPDEIMDGVPLEEFTPQPGVNTGTTVNLIAPKGSKFEDLDRYIENFSKYSNSPIPINYEKKGKYEWNRKNFEVGPATQVGGKLVGHGTATGTNFNLTIPANAVYGEVDRIALILSNRGMFQGVDTLYIGKKVEGPDRMVLELDPTVPANDPNYPLTAPTRELLKSDTKYDIAEYVDKEFLAGRRKDREAELGRIYNEMETLIGRKGAPPIVMYDTGNRFTRAEKMAIQSSPTMNSLGEEVNKVVNELLLAIPSDRLLGAIEKVGFLFDEKLRGVNLMNPSTKETFAILVNPFAEFADNTPEQASDGLVHIILHEFTHMAVREEGARYTAFLATVYEKFPLRLQYAASQRIQKHISDPNTGEYTPEIQDLLHRYTESRGRDATTSDVLIREASGLEIGRNRSKGITGSSRTDGEGATFWERMKSEKGAMNVEREAQKPIPDVEFGKKTDIERPSKFREAWNLARGLMSVDAPYVTSAAFRQGLPFIGTKAWFSAWAKAFKAFHSERLYREHIKQIQEHQFFTPRVKVDSRGRPITKDGNLAPKVSWAEEMGLELTDLQNINSREEVLRSTWAERIPAYGKYIRKSNRAYTAFLNEIRAKTFTDLITDSAMAGMGGARNEKLSKEIADFINTATGRGKMEATVAYPTMKGGKLGFDSKTRSLEGAMAVLADTFFSPRLMASRAKMLNPSTYVMASPMVRKQYLHAALRTSLAWGSIASLAAMAGAQVSMDPTSSDFGKIRIGNTRFDVAGGFQQYMVLFFRTLLGKQTSSTSGRVTEYGGEGYKVETPIDNFQRFIANKLHPTAKLLWDIGSASEQTPVYLGDRIAQMFVPMMTADLAEVIKNDPELAALTFGASSVGMGAQTYEGGPMGKPAFTPAIDKTFGTNLENFDYKITSGSPWPNVKKAFD